MIFDTHAHYDDEAFEEDRGALIASLAEQGIGRVVNVAADLASVSTSLTLAQQYPFIYAAVGVHPSNVQELTERDYEWLEEKLAAPKAVAVGEIGLDYYYDDASPRDVQRKIFEEQLALAKDLDVPVIIHNRDAHQDTLELLNKYRPKGIVHCFSGSAEVAKEMLRLGMYIGFTGVITFKNARRAVEAAAEVPLDRLLIETDCPYMAPEPFRGKRCDSTMLTQMAQKLAEIKGVEPQQLADQTFANACTVYSIR